MAWSGGSVYLSRSGVYEEGGEDEVGSQSDDVGDLAQTGDSPDETEDHQDPGQHQTAHQLPFHPPEVLPGVLGPVIVVGQAQSHSVEIILGRANSHVEVLEGCGTILTVHTFFSPVSGFIIHVESCTEVRVGETGAVVVSHHSAGVGRIALLQLSLAVAANGVALKVPAVLPGQIFGESHEEIEESPGTDDHVVDVDIESDQQHAVAQTLEGRHHPTKDLVGPHPGVLAHAQLDEEGGQTDDQEHQQVGDQETASCAQ